VAPGQRQLTYAPGLDGVRGLAVAAVVVYHLGAPWLVGGFIGVDVFFVLSGFLITSVLMSVIRAARDR
jgi:peptidoglycan/LPS O-acetylase OafA/YrhL